MKLTASTLALGFVLTLVTAAPQAGADAASDHGATVLGAVAARLASQIARSDQKPTLVVAAPLKSDEAAPRAAELAQRVATLVAGALAPTATTSADPLTLTAARTAGRKASAFVYVQAEIAHGELRVSGDVYRVPRNTWERVRDATPPPLAHGFTSGRIDAEVRSFLAPVPLLAGTVSRVTAEDRDILALACGDAADDGGIELVTVGRRRVALGRIRDGHFVARKTAPWSDLSPVAAAPLREPLGGAVVVTRNPARGTIEVGITDRAHGALLDDQLRTVSTLVGVPVDAADGELCASTLRNGDKGLLVAPCNATPPPLLPKMLGTAVDTVAIGRFVTVTGGAGVATTVKATRDPVTGAVTLISPAGTTVLPSAGAQLALADLDQDGEPEIATSLDVLDPATDALVVSSFRPGGPARERLRLPVPTGIRAMTTCPSEGSGASIVLATGEGLWLVR